MKKFSKVSVVILNWNKKDLVLECIESVKAVNSQLFEIVVVDNNSNDGSAEAVKEKFPDVILIKNSKNLGAIAGRNVGLKRCLETNPDYIFAIDNDLIADAEVINGLMKAFESDPQVGVAGAKIYDFSEPDLILSAGSKLDYTQNIVRQYGRGEKDIGQYDEIREVDWVGTGAMLVKWEVFEKIGLLDTTFIGYGYEDVDFGVMARKANYKVVFCPFGKVWHRPHSGIGKYTFKKKYLEARNAIYFMNKHAKFHNWLKYLVFVSLGLIYALFREGLRGNVGGVFGKIKGLYDGFRGDEEFALKLMNPTDAQK